MNKNNFQILSLDGGGIKGLFSAAVLAAIEDDLGIDVTDNFDLITGTSTGGIIALGLGLGLRPREIVQFYIENGKSIFPSWFGLKSLQHWGRRKYSPVPLENALKLVFEEKMFGNSKKRLVIPSFNLGEDDVYLFRTSHHSKLRRDYKVPAWKVAKATSAAPTYFPCCRDVDGLRLIDGGVWANNPAMVSIVEATGTLGINIDNIKLFSIGTSDEVHNRKKKLNSGGLISWARGNSAIDVIMRGQSIGVDNQTKFLLGKEKYLRINPKVATDVYSLDGVSEAQELVAKAAHVSRVFMPDYKEMFSNHNADIFNPCYENESRPQEL